MKKTKKLLPTILTIAMGITATFAFTACEKNYTTSQTDGLIAQVQTTIDSNKTELDGKINTLTEEYKAKDNELLAQITANQQAITSLHTEYAAKIAELTQADENNQQAIDELTAEYNKQVEQLIKADSANATALAALKSAYENKIAVLEKTDAENKQAIENLKSDYQIKIADIESKITQANETIANNKTALEQSIQNLTTAYEEKVDELELLISELQNTDKSQKEKIDALEKQVDELLKVKSYTVTFDSDGGSAVAVQTIEKGEKAKRPDEPIRLGYTFNGWYVDGEKWSFVGYSVTEDITLTAEWTANLNTLIFNGNGATSGNMNSMTVATDATITLPANQFTRAGYSFVGWSLTADGTVAFTDKANYEMGANAEYTLYAQWRLDAFGYEIDDNNEATITKYSGTNNNVIIPEEIWGIPVTKIHGNVSEFVELAKDYPPFWSGITITIPASVEYIGFGTFADCDCILNIFVNEENQAYKSIDGNLYSKDGTELIQYAIGKDDTCFEIPNGVTDIGMFAFLHCRNLTQVIMPDTVEKIGWNAFYCCDNLANINIPNSVTFIDDQAFGSDSLTSLIIPKSVTTMQGIPFWGKNLKIYCEVENPPSGWTCWDGAYTQVPFYWYSETKPVLTADGTDIDGKYRWHYDESGAIAEWTYAPPEGFNDLKDGSADEYVLMDTKNEETSVYLSTKSASFSYTADGGFNYKSTATWANTAVTYTLPETLALSDVAAIRITAKTTTGLCLLYIYDNTDSLIVSYFGSTQWDMQHYISREENDDGTTTYTIAASFFVGKISNISKLAFSNNNAAGDVTLYSVTYLKTYTETQVGNEYVVADYTKTPHANTAVLSSHTYRKEDSVTADENGLKLVTGISSSGYFRLNLVKALTVSTVQTIKFVYSGNEATSYRLTGVTADGVNVLAVIPAIHEKVSISTITDGVHTVTIDVSDLTAFTWVTDDSSAKEANAPVYLNAIEFQLYANWTNYFKSVSYVKKS